MVSRQVDGQENDSVCLSDTHRPEMNGLVGMSGWGWMSGWTDEWMDGSQTKNKYGDFFCSLWPADIYFNKLTFFYSCLVFYSDSFIRSRLFFCLTILSPQHFIELAVFISVNTNVSVSHRQQGDTVIPFTLPFKSSICDWKCNIWWL